MVTAFLIGLGILHCPCQMNHELLGHPFDSTGIITLWTFILASFLFFEMCQMYSRLFWSGWLPLSFLRGKKLVALSIAWEDCHKSGLSSTLPLDLGETDQERRWLKPGDALRGKSLSLTLFPYPPSLIAKALDSACQALSHCYSVHPR